MADQAGIDKMVVSHCDAIFFDTKAGNDALAAAMRTHPGRILGYVAFTSAYFGPAVLDEIDRCVFDHGMCGLKIYSHGGRSVAEPPMWPIVQRAAELGLPVLAHATAAEIEILAQQVPEATFLIAHLGEQPGANMWQALDMARSHPNVILDLTSSQVYAGMVESCVATVGAERIVFGTDMPLLEPQVQIQKVHAAQIDPVARQQILGGNAARHFGLNAEEALR
jgi:predicted TIM-barrel fold metal-dependent hydrolase